MVVTRWMDPGVLASRLAGLASNLFPDEHRGDTAGCAAVSRRPGAEPDPGHRGQHRAGHDGARRSELGWRCVLDRRHASGLGRQAAWARGHARSAAQAAGGGHRSSYSPTCLSCSCCCWTKRCSHDGMAGASLVGQCGSNHRHRLWLWLVAATHLSFIRPSELQLLLSTAPVIRCSWHERRSIKQPSWKHRHQLWGVAVTHLSSICMSELQLLLLN